MGIKCLARGHNTAPRVRIEPATLRSTKQMTNIVAVFFRVEKEKNQLKGEIDELQSQMEHVGKNRVSEIRQS